MGSIILKEEGKSNYTVIDGQQRLTTVTILAKAIYDCLPAISKKSGSGIRNCIENFLFFRKNAADDFEDSCIKIEHSKIDRNDYERVIGAGMLNAENIDLDTINENSSSVLQCYKYYCEELCKRTEKELRTLFSALFEQDHRVLVVIELEATDVNEQTIFDTINRAGVRLSTADIVKNNLYKHLLEKGTNKDVIYKIYTDCWEEVFNKNQKISELWDEERVFGNVKHNNLEFLLYCVACIKWGEDRDMFPNLAMVFEREVSKMGFTELKLLAGEIKDYALIFKKYILDFKKDMEDDQTNVYIRYDDHVKRLLLILLKFKVQMFYPYVLKRLYEVNQDESDQNLQSDFKKLESFVVRRKVSPKGTHDYTSKCYHIIKNGVDVLGTSDFGNPDGKISDFEIKQYLSNTKDDAAKMVLFCIELFRRRTAAVDVKVLEYVYTLEHIMPQKWERNWSEVSIMENGVILDPTSSDAKQIRNYAIQSLGNKTLLTTNLNSSVKNAAFTTKIKGDGQHKPGYEAYTTLFVTKEIVEQAKLDPVWDEEHIAKRKEKLYGEFLILWPCYAEKPLPELQPDIEDEDPVLSQYTDEQFEDAAAMLSAVPATVRSAQDNMSSAVTLVELEDFISCVNAQRETIVKLIRNGEIIPDLVKQTSASHSEKYFKKESIQAYAKKYGWLIITDENRKSLFFQMVEQMKMSYSYKPVFLKALFELSDSNGCVFLSNVVSYFQDYYLKRHSSGNVAEKPDSVFATPDCTPKEAERVILQYPYDRFKTMQVLSMDENSKMIIFNKKLWKALSQDEKRKIMEICDQKLATYFEQL